MIYETAVLARADLGEDKLATVKSIVSNLVQESEGEILVNDDWGVRAFAQSMDRGMTKGHYLYFMYRSNPGMNLELERRLGISEDIIRSLIVKLGPDSEQGSLLKAYKSPFSR